MFICKFWSHSDRHHFVHIVEVYNVFPLYLYITILIIAFLEIGPDIFQQMGRVIHNTFLLLLTKYGLSVETFSSFCKKHLLLGP